MAFGFAMGAFTAATYLAPALGGWGNVLKLSGVASILLGLIWSLIPRGTGVSNINRDAVKMGLKDSLLYVLGIRDVRMICLAVFGYGRLCGRFVGLHATVFCGQVGWLENRADLALTTFHIASLVATIPVTLLSDRWGRRQPFLLLGSSLLAISTALVPWMPATGVFVVMLTGGFMRDAFMSVFITRLMESRGIGPEYSGGALGLAMTGMADRRSHRASQRQRSRIFRQPRTISVLDTLLCHFNTRFRPVTRCTRGCGIERKVENGWWSGMAYLARTAFARKEKAQHIGTGPLFLSQTFICHSIQLLNFGSVESRWRGSQ